MVDIIFTLATQADNSAHVLVYEVLAKAHCTLIDLQHLIGLSSVIIARSPPACLFFPG